jgi:hypothetical protein
MFFLFTNGLVFQFEAVVMGQYGILILIMSFILELCHELYVLDFLWQFVTERCLRNGLTL